MDFDTTVVDEIPVETIQSALSYQITKYGLSCATSSQRCLPCMTKNIVQHLETLISHKSIHENPMLKQAYSCMLLDWERIKEIHDQEHVGKAHPNHFH